MAMLSGQASGLIEEILIFVFSTRFRFPPRTRHLPAERVRW